ncbi:MAG: tRNA epoxyqueuosine(34) reductase QueG [Alphaproteobacteria bacterium]|nr:tRNA epoxyqueuosine(34) reductase QueG [Alphaproteobacteria bacterium]MBV9153383.1 tRNA epoxyqueuosine(34) reductase QueG [Alphaproteobacteria bacterium]MBV9965916.1 tRNA epoxyqueuosine(34) reductase QueG [Alphaproteobacteria bacterium]
MTAAIREAIRAQALAMGFDAVGFAEARLADEARADLGDYIDRGYHGDMGWLAHTAERRGDPQALWPEARSVIVLGMNYGSADEPLAAASDPESGSISVYARGQDYHETVKKRLKALGRWIAERWPGELKVFVDTAPVMEKPLAQLAGLGWQGKHTNLVSREFGSWLFLGEIYLSLDLEPDIQEEDHCGTCRQCLDVCPTNAFPAPYRIDARRCISYLTIEHKGPIPHELRPLIGNRIFGCDDCLAVCPWNKFAQAGQEPAFLPREALSSPRLAELAMLDDAGFRALFAGTSVKRTGRDRFLRNVLIAIGNAPEAAPGLIAAARRCLEDPSPLVRGAAVWAFGRIADPREVAIEADAHLARERDPEVSGEWQRLLSPSGIA